MLLLSPKGLEVPFYTVDAGRSSDNTKGRKAMQHGMGRADLPNKGIPPTKDVRQGLPRREDSPDGVKVSFHHRSPGSQS